MVWGRQREANTDDHRSRAVWSMDCGDPSSEGGLAVSEPTLPRSPSNTRSPRATGPREKGDFCSVPEPGLPLSLPRGDPTAEVTGPGWIPFESQGDLQTRGVWCGGGRGMLPAWDRDILTLSCLTQSSSSVPPPLPPTPPPPTVPLAPAGPRGCGARRGGEEWMERCLETRLGPGQKSHSVPFGREEILSLSQSRSVSRGGLGTPASERPGWSPGNS